MCLVALSFAAQPIISRADGTTSPDSCTPSAEISAYMPLINGITNVQYLNQFWTCDTSGWTSGYDSQQLSGKVQNALALLTPLYGQSDPLILALTQIETTCIAEATPNCTGEVTAAKSCVTDLVSTAKSLLSAKACSSN